MFLIIRDFLFFHLRQIFWGTFLFYGSVTGKRVVYKICLSSDLRRLRSVEVLGGLRLLCFLAQTGFKRDFFLLNESTAAIGLRTEFS